MRTRNFTYLARGPWVKTFDEFSVQQNEIYQALMHVCGALGNLIKTYDSCFVVFFVFFRDLELVMFTLKNNVDSAALAQSYDMINITKYNPHLCEKLYLQ